MAKITLIILILSLLFACNSSGNFDLKNYQIVYDYAGWGKINLQTGVMNVDYYGLKYTDDLHFTSAEKKMIIQSFMDNRIDKIDYDLDYIPKFRDMPAVDYKIEILQERKIRSIITIDAHYSKGLIPFNEEHRVLNFKDDILRMLQHNAYFIQAKEKIMKYSTKNGILRL